MATLLETLLEKTAAQRAPIAGDSAGGVDASFEPDFETVKAEIDKLTSLGGERPNWDKVIATSNDILATKSKDVRLAIWSTVARATESNWLGFAEGLVIYQALVHEFWDTMFPDLKRARARGNLHAWMAELTLPLFEARNVNLVDAEAVVLCDTLLKDIDNILTEKLGEAFGGTGRVRNVIQAKARAAADLIEAANRPPPPPPPPEAERAEEQAAPQEQQIEEQPSFNAEPAFAVPDVGSADDAPDAIRQCAEQIAKAAGLLRGVDPADWWPYHLNRIATWLQIKGPPQDNDNRTEEPSPSEARAPIDALFEEEKWDELLTEAESATVNYPFWLDAHRFVAIALEHLGAPYREAREVVGRAVASFVSRYPTILSLIYYDDTPYADAATQHWVHAERIKWGAVSPAAAAWSAEDDAIEQRFAIARQMLAGRKIADGLSLAVAVSKRAGDARSRFRAQLTAARLAIEANQSNVARPILEGLLPQVDEYKLEAWDPDLCGTLYKYLIVAIRSLREPLPDVEQREAVLLDKLCRIDPAAALKLARIPE